jgi:hypothetical protein
MKLASLTTGLDDFGNEDFLEPLELLTQGYRNTANLNWIGRIGAPYYLHRMLCNRLNLTHHTKQHLQTEQVTISKPIFILGLPRTGSTLLHELLDRHPQLRAPKFWESTFVPSNPFNHPNTHSMANSLRKLTASVQIKLVDTLAPGIGGVHRLGTDLPHECVTLQAPSMRSMQFHAAHRLNAYHEWLETCDWIPAYTIHKQYLAWLQYIDQSWEEQLEAQSNGRARRWILKAPGHLLALDALIATYPDATFIQLHRNPAEVIPSMASLFAHLRAPFSKSLDLAEIGEHVSNQWAIGLETTSSLREQNPALNKQFIDVDYSALVSSPLNTANKILSFTGVNADDATDEIMREYLRCHPKNKNGTHHYTLEQFGLNLAQLNERFHDYNARYGNEAVKSKPD